MDDCKDVTVEFTIDIELPDFLFFNNTATTEIYTLSLHDALPIWSGRGRRRRPGDPGGVDRGGTGARSEEHTSELQSHSELVCRLLLEKKKKTELKHQDCYYNIDGYCRIAYRFTSPQSSLRSPSLQ